ncbi:hypothetical protein BD560DRAFT_446025 [Blakeslea trispora]|nr:hypothetical protein BD560DRAFT_446025 [Blakeslea trispora]
MWKRFFSSKPIRQIEAITELSRAVNSTPSKSDKRALLLRFPDTHATLKRIYDPHLRHHVSAKAVSSYLAKNPNVTSDHVFEDLNHLLDTLSSRQLRGHDAYHAIGAFLTMYCKTEEQKATFWHILDRNLKMGVSVQTIRQTLSKDNPVKKTTTMKKNSNFHVALATSLSKKDLKLSEDTWYASQKLDGVRCITFVRWNDGHYDIQFYSRTGRPFSSLEKLRKEFEKRLIRIEKNESFVLDGEICAYNESDPDREDFLKALGQVRRMNTEMENPVYQVFDYIPLDDFLDEKSNTLFSQRQQRLCEFVGQPSNLQHVKLVKQIRLRDFDHLDHLKQESARLGWEGLILRKDVAYEGKRTRNMLKVKEWEDAEYTVDSIETGLMRMPDTGETKQVMTNVMIQHKGNVVSVGSGFTMQSRIEYAQDPSKIIGKVITVRYFSESFKDNGSISLRFPTIKAIYAEGKRDV